MGIYVVQCPPPCTVPCFLHFPRQSIFLVRTVFRQTYCHTVGQDCSESFHGNLQAQANRPSPPKPHPHPCPPPPFVEFVRSNAMKESDSWPPNKDIGLCNDDPRRNTLQPRVSFHPRKGHGTCKRPPRDPHSHVEIPIQTLVMWGGHPGFPQEASCADYWGVVSSPCFFSFWSGM